ncbi:lipoprotein signal peptidase [Betaproteobacteria bacterium]|nr:lipoprotein signal peptidase [Betaproteobacteria bacterium]
MPDQEPARKKIALLAAWLALAAGVAVLDQISKAAILARISPGEILPVTSFFDLVLLFNRGAAFSLLAEHSGWQRWFFTVLALAVSAWLIVLIYQYRHERLLPTSFALICGGAIGNVIDRIQIGAVVDFLYLHLAGFGWPAFNLADSAITLGVILMVIAQLRRPQQPVAPQSERPA